MSTLPELLRARGWSWKRLATEAGVSNPVIYGIRNGNYHHVGMRAADKIADALGVSVTIVYPPWARAARLATKDLNRSPTPKAAQAFWWSGYERRSLLPCPTVVAEHHEAVEAVRAAIMTLPEHLRTVFVLRWYFGQRHREVAQALNIPVGTSKSRFHAATNLFADKLVHMLAG